MKDENFRLFFLLQPLIGLKRDQNAVADPIVLEYELGRGELRDGSFDVINHFKSDFNSQKYE